METKLYALFAVDLRCGDDYHSESEDEKLVGVFSSIENARAVILQEEVRRRSTSCREWQPDYWDIAEISLDSTERKNVMRL
jgi:hypothetical protein